MVAQVERDVALVGMSLVLRRGQMRGDQKQIKGVMASNPSGM